MRNAAEIYDTIRELLTEVEQLETSRRVTMSDDPSNTKWRDRDKAIAAARTGLEAAAEATAWMETRTLAGLAM